MGIGTAPGTMTGDEIVELTKRRRVEEFARSAPREPRVHTGRLGPPVWCNTGPMEGSSGPSQPVPHPDRWPDSR